MMTRASVWAKTDTLYINNAMKRERCFKGGDILGDDGRPWMGATGARWQPKTAADGDKEAAKNGC